MTKHSTDTFELIGLAGKLRDELRVPARAVYDTLIESKQDPAEFLDEATVAMLGWMSKGSPMVRGLTGAKAAGIRKVVRAAIGLLFREFAGVRV